MNNWYFNKMCSVTSTIRIWVSLGIFGSTWLITASTDSVDNFKKGNADKGGLKQHDIDNNKDSLSLSYYDVAKDNLNVESPGNVRLGPGKISKLITGRLITANPYSTYSMNHQDLIPIMINPTPTVHHDKLTGFSRRRREIKASNMAEDVSFDTNILYGSMDSLQTSEVSVGDRVSSSTDLGTMSIVLDNASDIKASPFTSNVNTSSSNGLISFSSAGSYIDAVDLTTSQMASSTSALEVSLNTTINHPSLPVSGLGSGSTMTRSTTIRIGSTGVLPSVGVSVALTSSISVGSSQATTDSNFKTANTSINATSEATPPDIVTWMPIIVGTAVGAAVLVGGLAAVLVARYIVLKESASRRLEEAIMEKITESVKYGSRRPGPRKLTVYKMKPIRTVHVRPFEF